MGNCLGRCLSGKNSLRRSTVDQDGAELVVEEETNGDSFIFKIIKFKKKKRPQFIEQFWSRQNHSDYFRMNPGAALSELDSSEIQLQSLDAQKLLVRNSDQQQQQQFMKIDNIEQTTNNLTNFFNQNHHQMASSSRASSSLDLEWEHEYAAGALANLENFKTNHHRPTISQLQSSGSSWLFRPEELSSRIASVDYNDRINYNYDLCDKLSNYNSTNNLLGSQNSISITSKRNFQQQQQLHHQQTNNNNTISCKPIRTPSRTSWSHISTPESLEWDIDEDQQKQLNVEDDNLDHETLELLHNIEMLKNKVLNETGDGLELSHKTS